MTFTKFKDKKAVLEKAKSDNARAFLNDMSKSLSEFLRRNLRRITHSMIFIKEEGNVFESIRHHNFENVSWDDVKPGRQLAFEIAQK